MVEVARILWKFVVGVKDLLALLFLILFFYLIYALLTASPNPGQVKEGVLDLTLSGSISEQPAAVDPRDILLSGAAPVRQYRARDIIRALRLAREDDRVKAVSLNLESFLGGGQVTLSAIGDEIEAVKKAGKPVYAYAVGYYDASYILASRASEIWVNPLGGVALRGPGGSRNYYKGLLEKTGIKANVYRVGTYKSAVEPYLRNDQSPEAKEALSAVYAEYWGDTVAGIKKARPKANIDAILADPVGRLESEKGNLAALSKKLGLVDRLGSKVAYGQYLAKKYGEDDESELPGDFASFDMGALLASKHMDRSGDPIAVITAAGTIVDGRSGPGQAAGITVSEQIDRAIGDEDTKAIVLRVDSPGGSVLASEKIRLALERAKAKKLPVVVSMANLAASGGYWISTPADVIFAESGTITGSIGIFGVLPSAKDALAKIGVTADGVRTTPLSGQPDVIGGFTPEFNRAMQSMIEKGYDDFLSRVAKTRGKTIEQVDNIAQGRIWAGATARQLGLVDRLGGMQDALAEAAKRAKLKEGDWHPRYYEPEADPYDALLSTFVSVQYADIPALDMFAQARWQQRQAQGLFLSDMQMLLSAQGMQAHCLDCGSFAGGGVDMSQPGSERSWLKAILQFN